MATTMMTEEDKKRQRNSSFPANPVPSGVVYKGGIVKNAAQSLASGFSPGATQAFMPGTRAVLSGGGEEISRLANQGNFGAAAGETARAASALVPALAEDVVLRPLAPLGRGIAEAGGQFLGVSTPSADQSASTRQPATASQATYSNEGRNYGAPGVPKPQYPGMPAASAAPRQTSFGNVTGDATFDARGSVSAQNMQAADALAARYAQPQQGMAQQGEVARGFGSLPDTGGYGLFDKNRMRERELRMAATDSRGSQEGKRAYLTRLAGANANLSAFQNTQNAAPQVAAAQQLGLRKQSMDEQGAASRMALETAKMREDALTGGVARQGAQLGVDAQKQMAALQAQYLAAPDDATRAKLSNTIAALTGKTKDRNLKDEFAIVGGGSRYDPNTGTFVPEGQVLVDLNTRQVVPTGKGLTGQTAAPTPGQKYKVGDVIKHSDGSIAKVSSVDANGNIIGIENNIPS